MSALAMFSLKDPSLLAFEKRRYDENIKNLFRVRSVPSDTQMRTILDPLEPDLLRPMFNDVLRQLQRGKALEAYVFHDGCYLLSLDGTGYFSSKKIHCESCLQKKNRQTGEITYQHQMLGAKPDDHQHLFEEVSQAEAAAIRGCAARYWLSHPPPRSIANSDVRREPFAADDR